jgi:hypothetical protein
LRWLSISGATHDHSTVGLANNDQVIVLRPCGSDDFTNVSIKISRWGRSIAQPCKSHRYGFVTVRCENLGDLLVDPATLPAPGDENKGGHIVHSWL